jgi:HSP20 family protein
MNQITNWNPLRSLTRHEPISGFDQLFRDFGMRPLLGPLGPLELPEIRIDVAENDKAYTIKADIPGVRKDDIDVAVEGRQVSITARSTHQMEKKDLTSLYTERNEGQFFRSFTLPGEVDDGAAEAKYTDGVLNLTLPKRSNGGHKRVKIV